MFRFSTYMHAQIAPRPSLRYAVIKKEKKTLALWGKSQKGREGLFHKPGFLLHRWSWTICVRSPEEDSLHVGRKAVHTIEPFGWSAPLWSPKLQSSIAAFADRAHELTHTNNRRVSCAGESRILAFTSKLGRRESSFSFKVQTAFQWISSQSYGSFCSGSYLTWLTRVVKIVSLD